MNRKKLRVLMPVIVLAAAGIAYVAHVGLGKLSAIGWRDIALLCPVGALSTMIASKTLVPHALISLLLAVVGIAIVGRAFCAWVCPVPILGKLRGILSKREAKGERNATPDGGVEDGGVAPLTKSEKRLLSSSCGKGAACGGAPAPTRHFVLGGALLSAAIFGFPVFCLICPIGLTFAGLFVLIALFGSGDVTWSVVLIPVLLAIEVVFFRKWCSHVCPVASLMSLVGRLNRTWRPRVDRSKCLVDTQGATCGRCAAVCEVGIDPHNPQLGAGMHECTKCGACVDACPASAVHMPFLSRDGEQRDEGKDA
ncbi:MAG: 4Fe-4S binding protein [Eggerthellaceae bacterium]|nr:4Fe-4S binding protein [Eggerthellaceae bacterium]